MLTSQVVKKARAPYKCGSCGQRKGNAHKCSGGVYFLEGVATVTSFYVYEDATKTFTADMPIVLGNEPCSKQQVSTRVSSQTAGVITETSDDLSVSATQSTLEDDDTDLITLPTTESTSSVTTKPTTKDAVAKFNRTVKLKAREESKLIRKIRKSRQRTTKSINYISDSSNSSMSSDSFETVEPLRRDVSRLIAESPMWGGTRRQLNPSDASIPCETSIHARHAPDVDSIFDAKGRVMDVRFDNECKFLQCFDDVDML